MSRAVPEAALQLIKHYEGFSVGAYLCPAGVWTTGWGHVIRRSDGEKLAGPDCAEEARELCEALPDAETLFVRDVAKAAQGVERVVKVPLTDGQFGALVSFVFNLGLGRLLSSTLLRKLNAGDYTGAESEFDRWVMAGGKALQGLRNRREAERKLFTS